MLDGVQLKTPRRTGQKCIREGCEVPSRHRGLCQNHYEQWRAAPDGSKPYALPLPVPLSHLFIQRLVDTPQGDDCIVWPFSRDRDGYGIVRMNRKRTRAHRLVCVGVYGDPVPPRILAAHSCGKGHLGCVNPNHLRWATHAENRLDMRAHGTSQVGEKNGKAVFTDEAALEIFSLKGKVSANSLAERIGVAPNTIGNLWAGRSYRHVTHP